MKENKIIPFSVPNKQRKKNKYNLCATIEVDILRNKEKSSIDEIFRRMFKC